MADLPLFSTPLLAGAWRELGYTFFRPGIRIHRLYGDGSAQAAAILLYEPGASVPLHEHTGFEHILILEGSQTDEAGTTRVGSLTVNPPGSRHSVTSHDGCAALLIWERPVRFVEG